jgi:hypothetical protein
MDPLTLIGAIPTALNTVNSLTSLFDRPYTPPTQYQENSREVFKKGGAIRGHNKYNAPQHSQGGQLVNDQGIPDPNGTNEIEGTESKYTYTRLSKQNPTYIFTPEDSQKVSKLTKKYKNSNTSDLEKNALELSIQRIEKSNEMKKKKQIDQYKHGGKIKKYNNGGGLKPFSLNSKNYSTQADNPSVMMQNALQQMNTMPTMQPTNYAGKKFESASGQFIADRLTDFSTKGLPQIQRSEMQAPRQGAYKVPSIQSGQEKYGTSVTPNPSLGFGDKPSTPATPDTVDPKAPESTSNPLKTLDTLRNLTLGASSLGLLRKAEKENPIMTDYSNARKELNKLDSNLDPMRQQYAQSSNQLRNVNRNSSSSYNSFANRESQRVANLQQGLAGVSLQEQQQKNSIAAQKAQFESGVAADNKQTLQGNRINNQQNAAVNRTIKSEITADGLAELDRKSTMINQANLAEGNTLESMAYLGTMFENFGPNDMSIVMKVKKSGMSSLTEDEKQQMLNWKPIKYKADKTTEDE